jgi:ATP-dependent Clp protease protease subunit
VNNYILAWNTVDAGFSERIIKQLLEWDISYKKEPSKDAYCVLINSKGGSLSDAWAVVDVMDHVSVPITTIACGAIESAALTIFTAGDIRLAYPHAVFLAHDYAWPHAENQANYGTMKDRRIPEDFMQNQIEEFYSTRTKLAKKRIRKIFEKEGTFFSIHQAKKWGFIDKVIGGKNEV